MTSFLRVLVVDDEKISRETTTRQLREAGYQAGSAENAFRALQVLEDESWDIVLTDLRMPNMDGLEFLKTLKEKQPEVDVILMTAYGTVETAVAAMQQGAVDYLTKPFSFQELELRLRKLRRLRDSERQLRNLRSILDQSESHWGLVGNCPAMRHVYELIGLFADNPAPVLITGETGSGKELVGRALHQTSARNKRPFIAIACGAIPREVAESELFGHEKGAFTGAVQRRRGSFERANHGTLLLDDVDDLPLDLQVKLMRVLQEGSLQRVGGEEEIHVDVRTIATTKVDLAKSVQTGKFREDMFYRLRGLEIRLPPLRERGEDILLLAHHFLRVLAGMEGTEPKTLTPAAGESLMCHSWPGNVRELRRVLEAAAAICRGPEIEPPHLPDFMREEPVAGSPFCLHLQDARNIPFNDLVHRFEEELIRRALKLSGGEQQGAAEILGLPRTTLQSKMSRRRQDRDPEDRKPE